MIILAFQLFNLRHYNVRKLGDLYEKVFVVVFFFCSLTVFSQTWTERALIAAGTIEYRIITKQEYERLLDNFKEDGTMCDIHYDDVFYVNDNRPISGTRPNFNGYYYLYGTMTTMAGHSRILAVGNSSTGRLEMDFDWLGHIKAGTNEFSNLYNRYIRRVIGE